MRRSQRTPSALVWILAALALLALPATALAGGGTLRGQVQGAGSRPGGFEVELFQARPGARHPTLLGHARTGAGGTFVLRHRGVVSADVRYLIATGRPAAAETAAAPVPASSYRLATALGTGPLPARVTVNDNTTVAMAYAMAQFLHGASATGRGPGLANSAAMAGDLADPGIGRVAAVLSAYPNGHSTSTLPTFSALANLSAACRTQSTACARLLRLARPPGAAAPADSLAALVDIATNPWHDVAGLFRLSLAVPAIHGTPLGSGERPAAWTLALRFEGAPNTMDGPGNFGIDAEGSLWVLNNYEYSKNPPSSVCSSEQLLRFTPTGAQYPGSPYEGGGVSGAGYGISFDPKGRLWVGNFGFAGKGCEHLPPHNSVSVFDDSGRALSPDAEPASGFGGGYTAGEISWPQGTVSDRGGNIWIANCGNSSVTRYGDGSPAKATNLAGIGLQKPFDIAIGRDDQPFVTSNGNSEVVMLRPDGRPAPGSPISGGGINRPMGIATDSRGYMWVANSGKIIAPCTGEETLENGPAKGSVTLIKPDGKLVRTRPFVDGGLKTPWGIAVDGDDHVWVANFSGKRLAELCGTRTDLCPPGRRRTGAAISPSRTGYGFGGLVRNTGVAIDPSGNVWLTNNWKDVPVQTNPGAYQIVAYLGLAAPIRTPLIGPPQRP